eukprot:COSAG02_NODE_18089_length_961_cov_7.788863_1_plen_98_part_10
MSCIAGVQSVRISGDSVVVRVRPAVRGGVASERARVPRARALHHVGAIVSATIAAGTWNTQRTRRMHVPPPAVSMRLHAQCPGFAATLGTYYTLGAQH